MTFDTNDIIGKKFGKLLVKSYVGRELRGKKTWEHIYLCDCDCGQTDIKAVRSSLIKGDKISCGCAYKDAGERTLESLVGQRFGRWTVIDRAPNRVSASGKTRSIMWNCKCDCGRQKIVAARALKTGMSLSCGCLQKERVSEALTDDLTGQIFGHLTVLYRNGSWYPKNYGNAKIKGGVRAVWHCKCDCGAECDAVGEFLKSGDVTSCGCSHTSKYEMYVLQYLENHNYKENVDFVREKTFSDLIGTGGGYLRYDFYLKLNPNEPVVIECQGEQHYKSVKWFGGEEYYQRLVTYDKMKYDYAVSHNIRVIYVPYTLTSYDAISKFLVENNL